MSGSITLERRLAVQHLYARYAACLDHGQYKDWPGFFTEDCEYKVIPRENYDSGHPLATIRLTSRAMLVDRVYAVENTLFHAPYYQRHIIGLLLISDIGPETAEVESNYCVIRTKRDAPAEIFNTGRFIDRVVFKHDQPYFSSKLCVFDNDLIPNSIIYPI